MRTNRLNNIHFIGIGGIGMSGIAEVLHNMGYFVSGSDLRASHITDHLIELGAKVFIGHDRDNLSDDTDVVVYSNAVPEKNPEIVKARERKIPIIPRAEMLNELLRIKRGIGISGTHGKTTTTSMMAFILNEAGWDPTMIIGGILNTIKSNAHLGEGEFLVYEACEAFGSINYFNSGEIIAITNIDNDHMEFYGSLEDLKNTFLDYINKVPFYGFAALNGDDIKIKSLIPRIEKRYFLFGLEPGNHVQAYDIKTKDFTTTFKVKYLGEEFGSFELQVPGKHNIYNSLAAITIAIQLGISAEVIQKSLCKFVNADRRFQFIGEVDKVYVIDDYAHHPTEVEATVDAAFQLKNGKIKRVITIFQPHLYTRTQLHHVNFGLSLAKSDYVLLNEIYPAREEPIEGVSSALIEDVFKRHDFVNYSYCKTFEDTLNQIELMAKPGDLFITMGAGDVFKLGQQILDRLKKKPQEVIAG